MGTKLTREQVEQIIKAACKKDERPDLAGANLNDTNLLAANLSTANLSGANLRGAILSGALLEGVDLIQADLTRTNLIQADLRQTDLSGANLNQADLRWANLSRANLRGADFSQANLVGANLGGAKYNDTTIWPASFDPTWSKIYDYEINAQETVPDRLAILNVLIKATTNRDFRSRLLTNPKDTLAEMTLPPEDLELLVDVQAPTLPEYVQRLKAKLMAYHP